MGWLWIVAGWFLASCALSPLVGLWLRYASARTGTVTLGPSMDEHPQPFASPAPGSPS